MPDACTTTQMSLRCVVMSRRILRKPVLIDWLTNDVFHLRIKNLNVFANGEEHFVVSTFHQYVCVWNPKTGHLPI